MINRDLTRTILNTTETTQSTSLIGGSALDLVLTTTDYFYVGYHGKFSTRYIEINTANTNASTMSVDYWDGTLWSPVDDLLDQTNNGGKTFAQSGFISWINKTDWKKRSLTGIDTDVELFWVRISVSADLSAGTKIYSVSNLFSDDGMLSEFYPELVSDTRWLPTGQTNFLKQHHAAKNLIISKLKQRNMIEAESNIIDINPVSIASIHACSMLILTPVATTEAMLEFYNRAKEAFDSELKNININIDVNQDGVVSDFEKERIYSVAVVRR